MDLLFATTNPGKIQSMRRELEPYGVNVVQAPIELPEPRSDDVETIATHKVIYAYERLGKPVVALDAGFYIDSLNGFPRAFVNFALQTIGLEGILRLVEGKDRRCEFSHCIAYHDGTKTYTFTDHVPGQMAAEPRGTLHEKHWSELALVFIPDGLDKTLAEMPPEDYARWHKDMSRDDTATKQFARWYLRTSPR
ncbi:MAG: non-canonical purine NTP pyrophosphatase [Nanoarchaeota archaeon]